MRYFFAIPILFLCFFSKAQSLVAYEYFIDSDPGVGLGTKVNLNSPIDSSFLSINIPSTNGLTSGFHYVGVRVLDDNGNWSTYAYRSFKVADTTQKTLLDTAKYNLLGYEYFIDFDPGIGKGVFVGILSTDSTTTSINIPETNSLLPGFHYVGIRAIDEKGNWGQYSYRSFKVEDTTANSNIDTNKYALVGYEYFIDSDPGIGKGVFVAISSTDSTTSTINIPETEGLSPGFHYVGVRAVDEVGNWGQYSYRSFKIEDTSSTGNQDTLAIKLVGYEYFIDSDPGIGKGIFVPIENTDSSNFSLNIPETDGLDVGFHFLGVRALNEKGNWGHYMQCSFKIKDTAVVISQDTNQYALVGYEYFIGEVDPGVGMGVYKSFLTSNTYISEEIKVPSDLALPIGEHKITLRTKDSKGKWSHNITSVFEICLNPPLKPSLASGGSVCNGGGNISYSATGSPSGQYAWYTQSSGGVPFVSTTDSFLTRNITTSEVIYVATKSTLCNSSRIAMQGLVIDKINTPVVKNSTRCGAGKVEFIPISGAPLGGTYRWYANNTDVKSIFTGDIFVTDSIQMNTSYYVEAITKDSVCKSDNKLGVIAIIKSCIPQVTIFPDIPNVIFGVDEPIPLGAFALDDDGNPTGQKINYQIVEGQARAFIKNDTVFFTGIGIVKIKAFTLKDTTYTYSEAFPVDQDFNIRADAAEVDINSNSPLCEKDRLILTPSLIKDGTYSWKTPSGAIIKNRVVNIYPVSLADTGLYRLTVITPFDTLVSSEYVIVNPAAEQVYLDTSKISDCANRSYRLSAKGGDFEFYKWYLDGVLLTTTDSVNFYPYQTGVYNLFGVDVNNCFSSTPPLYIDLEPDTVPSISFDRQKLVLKSTPGIKYQWYIDNFLIANGTKQEMDLYVNGNYKVEVVTNEGCTYFSKEYYVQDSKLSDLAIYNTGYGQINLEELKFDRVQLYPQPAEEFLIIVLKSFRKEQANTYDLLNFNGSIIKSGMLKQLGEDLYSEELDVSDLSSGVYYLNINNSNYVKTEKVIIE